MAAAAAGARRAGGLGERLGVGVRMPRGGQCLHHPSGVPRPGRKSGKSRHPEFRNSDSLVTKMGFAKSHFDGKNSGFGKIQF